MGFNVELAPPRLAEARACSAEALAEATVPAALPPGLWRCPKQPCRFPSTWKKPFGHLSLTGVLWAGWAGLSRGGQRGSRG